MRTKKILPIWWGILMLLAASQIKADSIERVGACSTTGSAIGVYPYGQYAFIADGACVTSVDISNYYAPIEIDFLSLAACTPSRVIPRDTLVFLNSAFSGPAFTVVNASDPYSLARLSWVVVNGYGGITPKGLAVDDTICYFADSDGGFIIISIADIMNPSVIYTMDTPGSVVDFYIKDTLAYVVDFDSLFIINVSDPVNPFIIGRRWIIEGGYDVWVNGNYAFLTEDDYNGTGSLYMIDVSDPTNPIEVRERTMNGIPYGIFVQGDRVYIAADDYWYPPNSEKDGRADIEGGIRVFRWAEPDTLDLLLSFDTPGRCRDIFVQDSFLFVAVADSFMIYKYASEGVEEEKIAKENSSFDIAVYPTLFDDRLSISLILPSSLPMSIDIYDVAGRRIRHLFNGWLPAGQHEWIWDCNNDLAHRIPPGIYFIKAIGRGDERISRRSEKAINCLKRR